MPETLYILSEKIVLVLFFCVLFCCLEILPENIATIEKINITLQSYLFNRLDILY